MFPAIMNIVNQVEAEGHLEGGEVAVGEARHLGHDGAREELGVLTQTRACTVHTGIGASYKAGNSQLTK